MVSTPRSSGPGPSTSVRRLASAQASCCPYPRLATELGLQERVSFLGFRRDIPAVMQAVDLFVFPSRYEACSLVLLEAAASGLPIVAARTTGGAELLSRGCSVLVKDPDDLHELAAELNQLLANPAELARMGEESRRIALANSWQVMAQHYLQLYRDLLQSPRDERADGGRGEARTI